MKTAYIFLGPPLSGKSTKSIELGIPRFSVRHWFEPQRVSQMLPPIGTFLPDEIVFQAVQSFLLQNNGASEIVFDGFPGSTTQFEWLKKTIMDQYDIQIEYCSISKNEALSRMKRRVVCPHCDGGADPVDSFLGGVCPHCGNSVLRRADDTVDAFERRWKRYYSREMEMAVENSDLANAILKIEKEGVRMDLHMHSNFSDGIYSPNELISLSKRCGLKLVSLTDHDSLDGVLIAETEARKQNVIFVPGIEISALFEGQLIHILGYDISIYDESLQRLVDYNKNARIRYDEKVLTSLVNSKMLSVECLYDYGGYQYDGTRGGWKLLNYLIEKHVCKDGFEYFDLLKRLNVGEIPYADVSTAIKTIKESGVCIVAHPGTYGWNEQIMREKLNTLYQLNVDGFECYHPLNKITDQLLIKEFCNQYNLIYTGGSDYHGNLSDRILGHPICYSYILQNTRLENK